MDEKRNGLGSNTRAWAPDGSSLSDAAAPPVVRWFETPDNEHNILTPPPLRLRLQTRKRSVHLLRKQRGSVSMQADREYIRAAAKGNEKPKQITSPVHAFDPSFEMHPYDPCIETLLDEISPPDEINGDDTLPGLQAHRLPKLPVAATHKLHGDPGSIWVSQQVSEQPRHPLSSPLENEQDRSKSRPEKTVNLASYALWRKQQSVLTDESDEPAEALDSTSNADAHNSEEINRHIHQDLGDDNFYNATLSLERTCSGNGQIANGKRYECSDVQELRAAEQESDKDKQQRKDAVSECQDCGSSFNLFRWKHSCTRCLLVLCDSCSCNRCQLSGKRICQSCQLLLTPAPGLRKTALTQGFASSKQKSSIISNTLLLQQTYKQQKCVSVSIRTVGGQTSVTVPISASGAELLVQVWLLSTPIGHQTSLPEHVLFWERGKDEHANPKDHLSLVVQPESLIVQAFESCFGPSGLCFMNRQAQPQLEQESSSEYLSRVEAVLESKVEIARSTGLLRPCDTGGAGCCLEFCGGGVATTVGAQ